MKSCALQQGTQHQTKWHFLHKLELAAHLHHSHSYLSHSLYPPEGLYPICSYCLHLHFSIVEYSHSRPNQVPTNSGLASSPLLRIHLCHSQLKQPHGLQLMQKSERLQTHSSSSLMRQLVEKNLNCWYNAIYIIIIMPMKNGGIELLPAIANGPTLANAFITIV